VLPKSSNLEPWEGFLLLNKPVGISSFGVIPRIRKLTGQKKIGHAGTLDPFASGLLVLALGRTYTRQISCFQDLPKKYLATVVLGIETDSLDITGQIIKYDIQKDLYRKDLSDLETIITAALPHFTGEQWQVPPQFSAKKSQGVRAYKIARAGNTVDLPARQIWIYDLRLLKVYRHFTLGMELPHFELEISCSKGTYIRSLAKDIGEALGTVASCQALTRTAIGNHVLSDACNFDQFCENDLELAKSKLFLSP